MQPTSLAVSLTRLHNLLRGLPACKPHGHQHRPSRGCSRNHRHGPPKTGSFLKPASRPWGVRVRQTATRAQLAVTQPTRAPLAVSLMRLHNLQRGLPACKPHGHQHRPSRGCSRNHRHGPPKTGSFLKRASRPWGVRVRQTATQAQLAVSLMRLHFRI